jgi:hypothetical protein
MVIFKHNNEFNCLKFYCEDKACHVKALGLTWAGGGGVLCESGVMMPFGKVRRQAVA